MNKSKKLIGGFLVIATMGIVSACSPSPTLTVAPTRPASVPNQTVTPVTSPLVNPLTTLPLEYAFTRAGQHPEVVLSNLIDTSKKNLDIAIYSITQPRIVQSILNAKKRGVTVRIITDSIEAKGKNQAVAIQQFIAAGIPVRQNTHSGLMHLKVTLVDGVVATTGSFNYSTNASTVNDEVLVVIRDVSVAQGFEAQFARMWADNNGFVDMH